MIKPRILIWEYNAIFGGKHAVTIPYSANFIRRRAHYSDLYFGASLKAISELASLKGYDLIGVNSAGMHSFFIRRDLSASFKKFKAEEIYFPSNIRESRDKKGKLSFLKSEKGLEEIKEMQVFDTATQKEMKVKYLYS